MHSSDRLKLILSQGVYPLIDKHKIINQIQSLKNSKYIEILYKHYVEFKRLEVVAVEMNFTYQYVVELHGYALKDFQTTYENLLNSYGEN